MHDILNDIPQPWSLVSDLYLERAQRAAAQAIPAVLRRSVHTALARSAGAVEVRARLLEEVPAIETPLRVDETRRFRRRLQQLCNQIGEPPRTVDQMESVISVTLAPDPQAVERFLEGELIRGAAALEIGANLSMWGQEADKRVQTIRTVLLRYAAEHAHSADLGGGPDARQGVAR